MPIATEACGAPGTGQAIPEGRTAFNDPGRFGTSSLSLKSKLDLGLTIRTKEINSS
jgi:hypothetical protein